MARTLSFFLLLLIWTFVCLEQTAAVKRQDFKTCAQSGFCRRTRALADLAQENPSDWKSPYAIIDSEYHENGIYLAKVKNQVFPNVDFELQVHLHQDGTARVLVDQVNGLRQRYNEAAYWALAKPPVIDPSAQVTVNDSHTTISYFQGGSHKLVIQHDPITLTFYRDGQPHIVLNERGLFNMEHFRLKKDQQPELTIQDGNNNAAHVPANDAKESYPHFPTEEQDGMWEETFSGHKDTKPKGPEALSLDISFPGYEHVFGIPQHAGPLSLRTTRGGKDAYDDPYRHHNNDIFEYLADSEMATYGAIPFMNAHRAGSSVGIFWLTGSETWVDITKHSTPKSVLNSFKASADSQDQGPTKTTTSSHWMSESGILDLFVFLGPSPRDLQLEFANVVGTTDLPQYFGIGNHQCRWNYQSQDDVLTVSSKFDEADIPLDVIWLDIEYAKDHEYFLWDERYFPEPLYMQKELENRGRQLVAIVDPHVKRDESFYVYTEARDLDLLIKNKDGNDYEGWCWAGSTAWIDFFNPKSWAWYSNLFSFDIFKGSSKNLWIWNDMNEPAVFNGPEITMPKDNIFYGGWEHRDVHNINSVISHNITARGMIDRQDPPRRPFVLARGFYAGTQRYGPTWQGDNLGTWEHMAASVQMTLSNSIAGMSFTGADVGGFFGNPSEEMLVRWYQAGAFYPFFRAHAHIDTKRREPYLFDEPIRGYIRDAIKLRYSLLPTWYTAFWHAKLYGIPIARPQYYVHPLDQEGFAIDDQFYVGDSGLLVKPITSSDTKETTIYLADQEVYYNYFTQELYRSTSSKSGERVKVPAPLDTIPLLQRGGHILAQRDTIRRSAVLMIPDPVTLVVALDTQGKSAKGDLFLDDGDTFGYQSGDYIWRDFELSGSIPSGMSLHNSNRDGPAKETNSLENDDWITNKVLTPSSIVSNGTVPSLEKLGKVGQVHVEKITILGLSKEPTCVRRKDSGQGLSWEWKDGLSSDTKAKKTGSGKGNASVLDIFAKPEDLKVIEDWNLDIDFASDKACKPVSKQEILGSVSSSECPIGRSLCKNEGHIPACILSSRVNDGLCEPECCDGSDETDGRIECPNICKKVNEEYQKEKAAEAEKSRIGSSIRDEYIVYGQNKKREISSNVERLANDLHMAEEKERELKDALEKAESQGAEELERKKSTNLFKTLVKHQETIKSLREERTLLDNQIDQLTKILQELKEGYNPNYQDMAVLGAVRNYNSWVEENNSDSEDDNGSSAEFIDDADLEVLETADPIALMDELDFSQENQESLLYKAEAYIPPQFKPHFEAITDHIVKILTQVGIIKSSKSGSGDNKESAEVVKAKDAHKSAQREVTSIRSKLEKERSNLEQDRGQEWEFKKLEDECVQKAFGEYTYELCFFGQGKQLSQGRPTNLGRFSSWNLDAEPGTEEYYSKQVYDKGQSCWNGPQRSIKVELVCDTVNALLSISEPEKCEYQFKASTPAVCKN